MPRLICVLPNASLEISGVKFSVLEENRLISDDVDDEVAAILASIPGYSLVDEDADDVPVPDLTPAQLKKLKKEADAAEAAAEKARKAQKVIDDKKAEEDQKALDAQKALDDQAELDAQKKLDDEAAAAAAEAAKNGDGSTPPTDTKTAADGVF